MSNEGRSPPTQRDSAGSAPEPAADTTGQEPSGSVTHVDSGLLPPELFFVIVAPVGADSRAVAEQLKELLVDDGYKQEAVHVVHVASLLHQITYEDLSEKTKSKLLTERDLTFDQVVGLAGTALKESRERDAEQYYEIHMNAGNLFCRVLERTDGLALFAAKSINDVHTDGSDEPTPRDKTAYIVTSCKRRDELRTLRDIYGPSLYVVGAYAPWESRKISLAKSIAHKKGGHVEDHYPKSEGLIQRDRREPDDEYGQRLSDTFPEADVFIDASTNQTIDEGLNHFLDLVFDHFFATPTHDEFGMFVAEAARRRSSDLSRQVGASVLTPQGSVLATGTNEVPKAGGGQVLVPPDAYEMAKGLRDHRDFNLADDSSSEIKQRSVAQLWKAFNKFGFVDEETYQHGLERVSKLWEDIVDSSEFRSVGEFGRSVHAEMACLMDAARRGISVAGAIMYTSTYPCHVCARHIVASGISRIVFIEPYPKSFALDLHMEALTLEAEGECGSGVPLTPYIGIAPRRYMEVFAMNRSRKDDLRPKRWKRSRDGRPAVGSSPGAYYPGGGESSAAIYRAA